MNKVCDCGKEFETNRAVKIYCSSKCQVKYSGIKSWDRCKLDYKSRCQRLVHMAHNRAKRVNSFFGITSEYVIKLWEDQDGCCALSGREFDLTRPSDIETVKANAPSLDRIDSSKGYEEGNVRLVCYQVNTALNEYGEEALISLCKDIINFRIIS